MRILHLEFGRHIYGGALQVAYLMRGLAAFKELENHLACPLESDLPRYIPEGSGAVIHPLRVRGDADIGVYWLLRELIRKIRPDILHIHSRRGADLWGVLAARRLDIPYILTRRVDNADASWLTRWRTSKASFVVGISRRICEVMREGGADPAKIRCILSTVDTDAYAPGGDRQRLASAADIPSEAPAVGIIAQLIERKGHRVLFKAIPEILAKHPDTFFLVFGKGPLEVELKNEAAAEPWADHVRFMGFCEDLEGLLPCLDLVVHPAFMEGLGVSLLQASACGVPVVACEAGGIPEVVRHGENGLLVQPGDYAALADCINRLLGDPDRRGQMAAVGRRIAEEQFSIARMSLDYRDLYAKTVPVA